MKKPFALIPALASALLLWLAFFPMNWGPLAFVAIAPLLSLVRAEPMGRIKRYGSAYLGGLLFFILAINWMRFAHETMVVAWIALSFQCAFYWPLAIFLIRRLDRLSLIFPKLQMWSLVIAVPIGWVAVEYIRAHFPTGFPILKWVGLHHPIGFGWYYLGHTQHNLLAMIQISDITGVFGVSFAVAAVNAAACEWMMRINLIRRFLFNWPQIERFHGWTRPFFASAIAAGCVALPLCYGFFAIVHPPYEKGPRVAAIQASMSQSEKEADMGELFMRYDKLCRIASPKADLVVWPETCFPAGWYGLRGHASWDNAPDLNRKNHAFIDKRLKELMTDPKSGWKVPVLLGASAYDWDGQKEVHTNSAVLIDREGNDVARYDKIHLVPFGEYVPLVKTFPFLQKFTPYKEDYSNSPGQSFTRFPLMVGDRQYLFGCIICYEDSDPTMCRPYVTGDEKVDFLINISNDAWFDGSEQHEQHLAISRFRAVETRRSIVRAVNMGISAIIDPDGRIQALPGDDWATSKRIDGTVTDFVRISNRDSWYAKFGDWFACLLWLLVIAGWVTVRKFKAVNPTVDPYLSFTSNPLAKS